MISLSQSSAKLRPCINPVFWYIYIYILNFGTESFYFIHLYYSLFFINNKKVNLRGFDFQFLIFFLCLSVQKPREHVADAEVLLEIIHIFFSQLVFMCDRVLSGQKPLHHLWALLEVGDRLLRISFCLRTLPGCIFFFYWFWLNLSIESLGLSFSCFFFSVFWLCCRPIFKGFESLERLSTCCYCICSSCNKVFDVGSQWGITGTWSISL